MSYMGLLCAPADELIRPGSRRRQNRGKVAYPTESTNIVILQLGTAKCRQIVHLDATPWVMWDWTGRPREHWISSGSLTALTWIPHWGSSAQDTGDRQRSDLGLFDCDFSFGCRRIQIDSPRLPRCCCSCVFYATTSTWTWTASVRVYTLAWSCH